MDNDTFIIKDGTLEFRKDRRTLQEMEENGQRGTAIEESFSFCILLKITEALGEQLPPDFKLKRTGKKEWVGSIWYDIVPKAVDTRPDLYVGYKDKEVVVEIQDLNKGNRPEFRIKEHKMRFLAKIEGENPKVKSFMLQILYNNPFLLSMTYLKQKWERYIIYTEKDVVFKGKSVYELNKKGVLTEEVKLDKSIQEVIDWLKS